jgi:hypothetical protein
MSALPRPTSAEKNSLSSLSLRGPEKYSIGKDDDKAFLPDQEMDWLKRNIMDDQSGAELSPP